MSTPAEKVAFDTLEVLEKLATALEVHPATLIAKVEP
jgi:hypothetical protein